MPQTINSLYEYCQDILLSEDEDAIEMQQLIDLLEKHEGKILAALNEEGQGTFEKFKKTHTDFWLMQVNAAFIRGFKLSARILCEVFSDH